MNAHDIFLEWVHLANQGKREATFPAITDNELHRLRKYESGLIQNAKISVKDGKTVIRLL